MYCTAQDNPQDNTKMCFSADFLRVTLLFGIRGGYITTIMYLYLFIYSTISRETPNGVLRNPGWETLL
jgi:hypothetical protein